MNLTALIAAWRTVVDDTVAAGYLWSDAEATEFINEAEREACLRARLLRKTLTAIPLVIGTPGYEISAKTIDVAQVSIIRNSVGDIIHPTSREYLNEHDYGWQYRSGDTRHYVYVDDDPLHPQVLLTRKPTVAGTLSVDVWHYPMTDMSTGGHSPAIGTEYHRHLIYWAAAQALMRRDADAGNEQLAAAYETKFEEIFGPRPHAKMQRQHARKVAPLIRPNPF